MRPCEWCCTSCAMKDSLQRLPVAQPGGVGAVETRRPADQPTGASRDAVAKHPTEAASSTENDFKGLISFRDLTERSPTSFSHQNRLDYYMNYYTNRRVPVGLTDHSRDRAQSICGTAR